MYIHKIIRDIFTFSEQISLFDTLQKRSGKGKSRNLEGRSRETSFVCISQYKGRLFYIFTFSKVENEQPRTQKMYISRGNNPRENTRSAFVQHKSYVIEMIYGLYFFIISYDGLHRAIDHFANHFRKHGRIFLSRISSAFETSISRIKYPRA